MKTSDSNPNPAGKAARELAVAVGNAAGPVLRRGPKAFTLLELLIVIAIMGILASIGLPALRGLGQSNRIAAVNRQLLDDMAYARMRALNDRSEVYVVFVPPTNIFHHFTGQTDPAVRQQLTNLVSGQYRSYAVISMRTVGDQPGQSTPRYLTGWKSLPEGMLFAPHQFDPRPAVQNLVNEYQRSLPRKYFPFPNSRTFPNSNNEQLWLPYIGFNSQGQLLGQRDEAVGISRGSIFYPKNNSGQYVATGPDLVLTPPRGQDAQYVRINWVTGRAQSELPELP
jgi:prepilin-type N-terminal cleavage/methylation domain-containing protein